MKTTLDELFYRRPSAGDIIKSGIACSICVSTLIHNVVGTEPVPEDTTPEEPVNKEHRKQKPKSRRSKWKKVLREEWMGNTVLGVSVVLIMLGTVIIAKYSDTPPLITSILIIIYCVIISLGFTGLAYKFNIGRFADLIKSNEQANGHNSADG
ncbi:hypothetical protein protein, putative [Babesia ovis]|uniref:Uncharacterized protein n=1 Tax=Babesia ovis TaxID=5869 RepID=A0A9W5WU88_BABOV|nr:hypothetical protein protein, putative [Babesia ovis]